MPPSAHKTVLILGGTAEGRRLADALMATHGQYLRVVSSLAGATKDPRMPAGEVRVGGFGGADGLAGYLETERIDLVVDATHPFAATISTHAIEASARTDIPLIAVVRPAWTPVSGDRWISVPDIKAAAREVSARSDVTLLTTGVKELAAFAGVTGVKLIVRLMAYGEPEIPLPDAQVIVGKPPYTLADEIVLYRELGIDTLVSKNAGGDATRAKLDAARELGIPVIMIERPKLPPRDEVASVDAALAAIEARLSLD